ncbi:FAD-dependent oxidoreductase [Streptomyces sp. PRKS01-65]|nr:FAD/NAD(P)-binding protein [Streptomyces harenosi]NEY35727.1 FAD-dependent oxidoreductase [Streptomyces harenosi]
MSGHLAVVGGGITGVAAFNALVAYGAAERISVIDPLPVGRGTAFATSDPSLICNTSVDTLSLVPEEPEDFLHHLRAGGVDARPEDFVPRWLVSRYARERFLAHRERAERRGVRVGHVRDRAVRVERTAAGDYRVALARGPALPADGVLVCHGYGTPVVPEPVREHLGRPRMFAAPYPERDLLAALPAEPARILVIGTRLSAIETTLLLTGRGHDVVMTSPSGELPAVRTHTLRPRGRYVDAAAVARLDLTDPRLERRVLRIVEQATARIRPLPLARQTDASADPVRRLRAETELAARGDILWQEVMVELIDLVNDRTAGTPLEVREQALRRCHRLLGRYMGAFPLDNARRLLGLFDAGRVRLRRGIPERLTEAGGWRAHWPDGTTETFEAVVCATGLHHPVLEVTGGALHLTPGDEPDRRVPVVDAELRVHLAGAARPERIWLLGIAAHLGVPLVNAVYPAARQAAALGRRLAGRDTGERAA